jgi:hypothetical protein
VKTCSIADCDGKLFARGWCANHYQRWYYRRGDPREKRIPGPPKKVRPDYVRAYCAEDDCPNVAVGYSGFCGRHHDRRFIGQLPTANLIAYIESRFCRDPLGGPGSLRLAAQSMGVAPHVLRRALDKPLLNVVTADRYACALGLHPALIWPEFYARAVA